MNRDPYRNNKHEDLCQCFRPFYHYIEEEIGKQKRNNSARFGCILQLWQPLLL